MEQLEQVRAELVGFLQGALDGMTVRGEYPVQGREMPVKRPYIAVGYEGVSFPGAGRADLALRFDILCPVAYAGGCHAVFERLCSALLSVRGRFGIGGISCGEIESDKEHKALALCAKAALCGLLLPEVSQDSGEELREVLVLTKGVLYE